LALCAASASAEVPAGPRLTFMRGGDRGGQLISSDPTGGDRQVLVPQGRTWPIPFPWSPPSWAADGSRIAFDALADRSAEHLATYVAAPDGSGEFEVPGTEEAIYPVLSPDGQTLAFAREKEREAHRRGRGQVTVYRSISVWLTGVEGGPPRQLTPWRNRLFQYPASFSPDGSTLAVSRTSGKQHLAVALSLNGGGSAVLAHGASEPIYSPDGTRLALITTGRPRAIESSEGKTTYSPTELAVANADGSQLRTLTHTRHGLEVKPSWDPSGERLVYTELQAGGDIGSFLGLGDAVMEINADGTCRTKVLSQRGVVFFGATWQPGPGREAGPIAC
jgi:Tol biopolymer transport system component